jgi:membrane associated rhomboid family serine protease
MQQMHLPQMSRVNKILVISIVTMFVLNSLAKLSGMNLLSLLGLSGQTFFSGHLYQLVTYAFIPNGLLEVIFDALILWFLGSEMEDLWGEKRYLSFLLAVVLGGGLIYLLISLLFLSSGPLYSYPLSGPAGVCSALCVVYGILFPDRQMYLYIFPVKAKWFAVILVGISLYQGIFAPGGVLAWSQIGAIVCGVVWMYAVSHPFLKQFFNKSKSSKLKRKNSHLRVVKDDDDITYH